MSIHCCPSIECQMSGHKLGLVSYWGEPRTATEPPVEASTGAGTPVDRRNWQEAEKRTAEAVADERREAFTRAARLLQTEAEFQERQAGEHEFQRDARRFAIQRLRLCERILRDQAAGSVPVATPVAHDSRIANPAPTCSHRSATPHPVFGRTNSWCSGPVATPTGPRLAEDDFIDLARRVLTERGVEVARSDVGRIYDELRQREAATPTEPDMVAVRERRRAAGMVRQFLKGLPGLDRDAVVDLTGRLLGDGSVEVTPPVPADCMHPLNHRTWPGGRLERCGDCDIDIPMDDDTGPVEDWPVRCPSCEDDCEHGNIPEVCDRCDAASPVPAEHPASVPVESWGDLAVGVMGLVDQTLDGEPAVPAEQPEER